MFDASGALVTAQDRMGRLALDVVCSAWVAGIWLAWPASICLSVDDAFYYLRISEHMAAGYGPTFDGVELTNGFHPLWVTLLTPLALLPLDADDAMRLALSLNVILLRAALAVLNQSYRGLEAVAAIALVAFWFTKTFVNGMESALVALLLAVALRAPERARGAWGVIGGLLILARLDAVFFVAPWLVRRPRAVVGVLGVLVPWLVGSFSVFGHVQPVSAAVKYGAIPIEAWVAAVLALVGAHFAGRWRLWPLCAYALAFGLIGGWFEVWRWVPVTLLLLFVARSLARARMPVLAAWCLLAISTWWHRLDPTSYAPYLASRRSGLWLREHTPPGAAVAGWDCGIAAAYSQRRFFQLEGLVGSWRYYEWMMGGRTPEWLRQHEVRWIAQPIRLDDDPQLTFDGVDLGSWKVARSECVIFRSITAPRHPSRRAYLVLRRDGPGVPLSQLVASGSVCDVGG